MIFVWIALAWTANARLTRKAESKPLARLDRQVSNPGAMMVVRHFVGSVLFLACLCQVAAAADVQSPGSATKALQNRLVESPAALSETNLTNAEGFLQRGLSYYDAENYTRAVALLKQAVFLEPTNFEANLKLGYSYYNLQNYAAAAAALRAAVQCKPSDPAARCRLGDALYALKRYDEAAAAYKQTLALATNRFSGWMGLGNCQYCRKEFRDAAESYQRCASLRPTNYSAHVWLGHSLVQLDQVDKAAAAFGRAASLRPHDYEANLGSGITLLRLSRFEEATSSLEQALDSKPNARLPRWGLLVCYAATGNVGKIPGLHLGIGMPIACLLLAFYLPAMAWLIGKSLRPGLAQAPGPVFALAWCSVMTLGQTVFILAPAFAFSWPISRTLGMGICLSSLPLFAAALLGFARQPWGEPFAWPPRIPGGKLVLAAFAGLAAVVLLEEGYSWVVEHITGKPIPDQMITSWLGSEMGTRWFSFVAITLVAPTAEEILFRGLVFGAIGKWLSGPWSIVVSAAVFAVAHLQPIYFLPLFGVGLVLGWARAKTGGLALPILLHSANNCAALLMTQFPHGQ